MKIRFIGRRKHENEKGTWNVVIECDDQPDNRREVYRYFYTVTGPPSKPFTYRISYSHTVSDPRYRDNYNTKEKRVEDGYLRTCMWIDEGKYEGMNLIVDTQGLREDVS